MRRVTGTSRRRGGHGHTVCPWAPLGRRQRVGPRWSWPLYLCEDQLVSFLLRAGNQKASRDSFLLACDWPGP